MPYSIKYYVRLYIFHNRVAFMSNIEESLKVPGGFKEDLRSLCELRSHIEEFAARRAATNAARGASSSDLVKALHNMEDAAKKDDYDQFHKTDLALHREMILMAGVPKLLEVWYIVINEQRTFSLSTLKECFPDLGTLMDDHRILVESICAGEVNAAAHAAATHLEGVWYRLAHRYENQPLTAKDPFQRATAYLAWHFHRNIKLTTIAHNVCFTSPGHLSRLFRQHCGMSFQKYVINMRLEKAAKLLRDTNNPVNIIANMVGYNDLSRFDQHFKRHFGKTPRAYRSSPAD